ncbi:hypothetical protein [Clostridium cylindrosporum]|uniref:Uncharacterized protein n=1 Tax=Clostridium cylindrosporum DSM 605 TaxID=1121307 RepID=A0A0J8DD65_CLOCY|nr:hypothetical protein [Clostridium cylindrosporum]KMT22188.1 hypothetical protein CLCY_4c01610 [Clostridium cylindrosporum DSM 605]
MVKVFKSKHKLMAVIALVLLILVTLFTYCYRSNYVPNPVSKDEASKLKIGEHFLGRPGSVLTYILAPDKYGVSYFTKQLVKPFPGSEEKDSKTKNMVYVYNYEGRKEGSLESYKSVKISKNLTENITKTGGDVDLSSDLRYIYNLPKWKISKHSTAYLTGVNLTISTPAGKFNDCIEITVETELDNSSKLYETIYSAKGIGFIMKTSGPTLKKQKKVYELYKYNIPAKRLSSKAELENFTSKVLKYPQEAIESPTYHNEIMGITLSLPEHWVGKCGIDSATWSDNIKDSVTFNLKAGNKSYQRIFSIHMLKKGYDKNYVDKNRNYVYIGEYNGHTLVYSLAKNLSSEVELTSEIKNEFDKMMRDVPNIISNIKYE